MFQHMLPLISAILKDRKGVSSLEYAILAFGIIGAVTAAMGVFTTGLSNIFQDIIADLPTHS
jgi:Flp pilus assembly pilin Flp